MPYTGDDLVRTYGDLGIGAGAVVYVIAALWRVPDCASAGPEDLAAVHYDALRRVVGDDGTIVVSTASLNLCNTSEPFDPAMTPSFERGIFSEYVRALPDARRSFHPFVSYAAVGGRADEVTDGASRHGYGPETPEARLINLNATILIIGAPLRTCTAIHHAEQVMGVPYRYSKEFIHPVVRDGDVRDEPFYLYVRYGETDIGRDGNRTLFERLDGRLKVRQAPIGRGVAYAYGLADFFHETTRLMADDIYLYCGTAPVQRPWQH
jgi:aminoglycoside 3-N-acetyltransferase